MKKKKRKLKRGEMVSLKVKSVRYNVLRRKLVKKIKWRFFSNYYYSVHHNDKKDERYLLLIEYWNRG